MVVRLCRAGVWVPLGLIIWFVLLSYARGGRQDDQKNLRTKKADPLSKQEIQEAALANMNKKGVSAAATSAKSSKKFSTNKVDESQLTHAVIVAGHAVLRINKLNSAERDDNAWYLLSYQLNQGFPGIITSHIKRGIQSAVEDPYAMLLFSGGQTRRDVGPTSEAASYYYLANEKKWLLTKDGGSIAGRVYLEEHARDSYENLLYSICRFREVSGHYPTKVTVVGFDFKAKRFTDLHRSAIGFPAANFSYVGLRPAHSLFDHTKAARGEEDTIRVFKNDMYGCSAALAGKRDIRNPFRRTSPYELACPELKKLLFWCGPDLYTAPLPWSQ